MVIVICQNFAQIFPCMKQMTPQQLMDYEFWEGVWVQDDSMIISDLHPSQLSLWVWGESLSPKRRRSERVNVWCDWVQPANVSIHDAGMMCPNDQNDQQMRYPEMSSKFCLNFQAWIDVWSIVTLEPVRDHNVTRSSGSVYIRTSNWSKWRLISMPYDALPESLIAWSRFISFSEKLFFC